MRLTGMTRTTRDLAKAKHFYEEILGFERDAFYEPTGWQSYRCQEGVYYAVGSGEAGSTNEISFAVPDIEAFWLKVKERADVVRPLERTPWGTFRFVVRDPDGNLLAFAQE